MAGKNRFDLDRVAEIPSLKGLGDFEARKALPLIRVMFFNAPVQEDFVPCHPLRELNKEVA
jgi:hypothetical protein